MKLNDLKYYQALVKYKNFSQVAAKFNVSQPTITMAIQRLEKILGRHFLFVTMSINNCISRRLVSNSPFTLTLF